MNPTKTTRSRRYAAARYRALLAALAAAFAAGAGSGIATAQEPGQEEAQLMGKTALVTGSTDGLGREVAYRLADLGATVIVHGRNRERGEAVVSDIQTNRRGDAVFYSADLGSLEEVESLARTVLENHDRLDVLINNAGIWRIGEETERRTSADGHELVFAVNYLSGFLLTHRLLPLLERSAPARIVNVSSGAQRPIDFDNVMLERDYSDTAAYSQSKLAQVLFTVDLAEALEGSGVTANALHPATLMDTSMVEEAGVPARSTVAEGAEAVMRLAVSPELEGRSGLYFNGQTEARANAQAYDEEARRKLRELSEELTGLD